MKQADDEVIEFPRTPRAPELEDFLTLDFPPDDPVLGPIASNQVNLVAGPTGLGKTHLAMAIAHAIVSGRDLLSWTSHRMLPVLFIDGEMSGRQLQDRWQLYNFPDDREPLRVVNAIGWCSKQGMETPNLAYPEWHDIIAAWAVDRSVVILDNVMSLVHVPGVSLSSDEFWRSVTPLNLRLRAMGCTVIWVDHLNSEGRVFGTKTKEWLMNMIAIISPNERTPDYEDSPGAAFTLSFTKVRGERGPDHQTLDIEMTKGEDDKLVWSHVSRKQAEQEIAAELRAQGLKQREIAEGMGISLGKVNKLLKLQVQADQYAGRRG